MPKYTEYQGKEFAVLSYAEMDAYLQSYVDNGILEDYAGEHCGFGMQLKNAQALAKEEKQLPEEQWSISTHLTDWEKMFDRYAQLKNTETYDDTFDVMGIATNDLPARRIKQFQSLANFIFQGDGTDFAAGKHNGILNLYSMVRGIKEEKWAEMPEFAHYAKVLLRKCNLPLPVPRTAVPSRDEAAEKYKKSIKGDEATEENLRAMLNILAVKEPFDRETNSNEAIIFYEEHPDYEDKDEDMWLLYESAAHPILTAAKVFELQKNEKLMEYLKSPDAVREAKAGTLYEAVQEHVYHPEAEAKAKAAQEENERQRMEAEKQRAAEEKAERGMKVQAKRSETLLALLKRLGVSEADLGKDPAELKVSGSKEFNDMTRAALAAYQSASGEDAYDIDHDQRVRDACFAYTKGKKSVRTFESGRQRFETCLDLMMSVSEPNEDGVFPEDIENQFRRINEVRKTKPGDKYYVSPRYFKFEKNQVTVQEALENLHNHKFLIDSDNKLNRQKYEYVLEKLKASLPQLPGGGYDGRAVVEGFYFQDCYGPNRGEASDRLMDALHSYKEYDEEQQKLRRAEEEKTREEERRARAAEDERKRQEDERKRQEEEIRRQEEESARIREEQEKREHEKWLKDLEDSERLKQEPIIKAQIEAAKKEVADQKRIQSDKLGAKNAAGSGKQKFEELLDGILEKKQEAADKWETAKYRSEENSRTRAARFDTRQNELDEAWQKDYYKLNALEQVFYMKQANRQLDGGTSGAAYYHSRLDECRNNQSSAEQMRIASSRQYAEGNMGMGRENMYQGYSSGDDLALKRAVQAACRAFACTKLFKPDEAVDNEKVEEWAAKIYKYPALRQPVYQSVARNKQTRVLEFDRNSEAFEEAQRQFNMTVRRDNVLGLDVEMQAAEQKLNAGDVQQALLAASTEAMKACIEEKAKYDAAEKLRSEECGEKNEPYYKGPMPDALHAARDTAIRTAVAGHLAKKLFEDPDAVPDLNKLKNETEKVIQDGSFMMGVADMDMGMKLLGVVRKSCELYLKNRAPEPVQKSTAPDAQVKDKENSAAASGGYSAAH